MLFGLEFKLEGGLPNAVRGLLTSTWNPLGNTQLGLDALFGNRYLRSGSVR